MFYSCNWYVSEALAVTSTTTNPYLLAQIKKYLTYVRYVRYGMCMPDVKVYIRQENLSKWNTIASKSDWINTLLASSDDTSSYGKTIKTPVGPAVTVLSETLPDEPTKRPPVPFIQGLTTADKIQNNGICKVHGLPLDSRGRCMQKGCRYA